MSIEKVGFRSPVPSISDASKANGKKPESVHSGDRIEVSDEAKSMFAAYKAKQNEEIREKMRDGFYFSSQVTDRVVSGLLRDLKNAGDSVK